MKRFLLSFAAFLLLAGAAHADKAITFTGPNGKAGVVWPVYATKLPDETEDAFLARIQAQAVPAGATNIQIIDAASYVPPVDPVKLLADHLAQGIAVTSLSHADLSATYALDDTTLNQIGSVARDAGAGLGLPAGAPTFSYPDISGVPHAFDAASIQALYKAMRDLVFALNTTEATLAAGGTADWPLQTATIP